MPFLFSPIFVLEHLLWKSAAQKLQRQRESLVSPRNIDFQQQPIVARNENEAQRLFVCNKEPVLWKGGASGSRLDRWSLEYLDAVAGEIAVKILALPGLSDAGRPAEETVMPFKQFLAQLPNTPAYLRFSDLLERSDKLRADMPWDLLQRLGGRPKSVNLQFFLGPKQSGTPLHAEMNCNIFIQVFGKKRWRILPVEATPYLQVPAARKFYFYSPIDIFAENQLSPNREVLRGTEILLEPGDILLCPPLVWHAVENLTLSCSVGYKFNRYSRALRSSPLLFFMNLLARNPSYPTYLWQKIIHKKHPILASE